MTSSMACPRCGGRYLLPDFGEGYCLDCGYQQPKDKTVLEPKPKSQPKPKAEPEVGA